MKQNKHNCKSFNRSGSEDSNSDRPFSCMKCSKTFKLKGHLKNHEKIAKDSWITSSVVNVKTFLNLRKH